MLIMIKEVVDTELRDKTINPSQIVEISKSLQNPQNSVIKLTDGTKITVSGTVEQITKRINGTRMVRTNKKVILND